MSYEQKYFKYKQKYLDLKAFIHNENLNNFQTGGYASDSEASLDNLGSSPVTSVFYKNQEGGKNYSEYEFSLPNQLTDSPVSEEQLGGKKKRKEKEPLSSSSSESDSELGSPSDSEISISSMESSSSEF